jgi:hypothetical protein
MMEICLSTLGEYDEDIGTTLGAILLKRNILLVADPKIEVDMGRIF